MGVGKSAFRDGMCCVAGDEVSCFGGDVCFGVGGVGKSVRLVGGGGVGVGVGVCGVGNSGCLVGGWDVGVGVCVVFCVDCDFSNCFRSFISSLTKSDSSPP